MILILLLIFPVIVVAKKDHEQDQDHEQEYSIRGSGWQGSFARCLTRTAKVFPRTTAGRLSKA
jgi:hypothetical protein